MKSRLNFLFVVCAAIFLSSAGSHFLANWLRIETHAGAPFVIGSANLPETAYLAGSSLAGYGISWETVSRHSERRIIGWGIAGGSPFEWREFQPKANAIDLSFIVVSAYDLNEAMICDYRAQVVPLSRTLNALRTTDTEWPYKKRALSQYPMSWLRTLYPTIGRSKGVMGDLRTKLSQMVKRGARSSAEPATAGPVLNMAASETAPDPYKQQKITDWSESEVLRKLAVMGSSFQGQQSFTGPKLAAFDDMLKRATRLGRTVVIVLPVSQSYSNEFLKPAAREAFDSSIRRVLEQYPQVSTLRLDQHPTLGYDKYFCDLVHMNYDGQRETTGLVMSFLRQSN